MSRTRLQHHTGIHGCNPKLAYKDAAPNSHKNVQLQTCIHGCNSIMGADVYKNRIGADVYKNSSFSGGFKRPTTDLILTHYQSITNPLPNQSGQPKHHKPQAPQGAAQTRGFPTDDQKVSKSMLPGSCTELENNGG